MEQCNNSMCSKPATTEKVVDAPFSMSGKASQSVTIVRVCDDCVAQDKRMEELNK